MPGRRPKNSCRARQKIDSSGTQADHRRFASRGRNILGRCSHGDDAVPGGDICREFLDECIDKFDAVRDSSKSIGIGESYFSTVEKYSEGIWSDSTKVDLIVSIFVSNGAHNILNGDINVARQSAFFACYFEQYMESVLCRKKATINWQKVQEFEKADENTLMAYVRKRIPCSCLDKKYKEVKRIVTKMGTCNNPHCSLQDRQVELRTMKECSYCCRAFYCSRRCS